MFKVSNDPQFEENVTDVVGRYLNPPNRALAVRGRSRPSTAPSRACKKAAPRP
jgi:hypothetical protein